MTCKLRVLLLLILQWILSAISCVRYFYSDATDKMLNLNFRSSARFVRVSESTLNNGGRLVFPLLFRIAQFSSPIFSLQNHH